MEGYRPNFSITHLNEEGHPVKMEAVITGPDAIQRRVSLEIKALVPTVPDNWPQLAAAEADFSRSEPPTAPGGWRPF